MATNPVFLSTNEAADLLGISSAYLIDLVKGHGAPHARCGKIYRFHRWKLLKWWNERKEKKQ